MRIALNVRSSRRKEAHFRVSQRQADERNQSLVTSAATNSQSAFTMVEIAIALGVIAFALVAIIGVLPMGMNVQRENREDTIINQDGPYFLEAIRSGAQNMDHLSNFVEKIGIVRTNVATGGLLPPDYGEFAAQAPTGRRIVSFLSIPKGKTFGTDTVNPVHRIEAHVRAISGSAIDHGAVISGNKELAFSYLLTSEVVPYSAFTTPDQDFKNALTKNFYDIRLGCRWPLLPNDKVGKGRKTFRSAASASLVADPVGGGFLLQPQKYDGSTNQP